MDFTGHGRSEGSPADATDQRMLADLRTVLENVRILHEVDPDRIGINGAGTGGDIATQLASEDPGIAAMVIRGPLSGGEIRNTNHVQAPTLLIHGEHDPEFNTLAESTGDDLASIHRLLVIPESNRWFNDPISLELMVSASVDWLVDHLRESGPQPEPQMPTPAAEAET